MSRKLTIESFSVSYSFDTYRSGEKRGTFVSTSIKADPPIPIEEFPLVRLDASYLVARSTIVDAMIRSDISEEDARERIKALKANTDAVKNAIMKRLELEAAASTTTEEK